MLLKRTKKIFTAAISLLFVLSIGYFAVLPPTSAWFYQKYDGVQKSFIFGSLAVQSDYTQSASIDLPDATKLEDNGETLFDQVIQVETINAQNTGNLPARVYLTVTQNSGNPAGLHYFYYDDSDTGTTVRDKIAGKNIITPGNASATYTALNLYNVGNGVNNNYGHYILVQPGEAKTLKIAFWVDYNAVGSTLGNTSNVAALTYNNVQITLSGVQDTDGAFTR
jgi:hypothetical protein